MSMIMRVARGSADDLERMAEFGGDGGAVPQTMASLLTKRPQALANIPPEIRSRMLAAIQAHPQLSGMSPAVLEGLRRGIAIVPPSGQFAAPSAVGPDGGAPEPPQPESIDLYKSWHIFHFLFTDRAGEGGTPPASLFLEGGREIGDDMGYGPARLLDAVETASFAWFVGGLSVEELTRRIDGLRMASLGIYCAGDGSADEVGEMADDVAHYFPRLQAHFQAAAAAGQSTLIWLT